MLNAKRKVQNEGEASLPNILSFAKLLFFLEITKKIQDNKKHLESFTLL